MRELRERGLHSTTRFLTLIDPGERNRSDRMFLSRDLPEEIQQDGSDESALDISQQGTRPNSAADNQHVVDMQNPGTADDMREEDSKKVGAWAGPGERPKIALLLEKQGILSRIWKDTFSVINATEHQLYWRVQEDPNATVNMASNCSGSVKASWAIFAIGWFSQNQRAYVREPSLELGFQPIYPGNSITVLAYHGNVSKITIRGAEEDASTLCKKGYVLRITECGKVQVGAPVRCPLWWKRALFIIVAGTIVLVLVSCVHQGGGWTCCPPQVQAVNVSTACKNTTVIQEVCVCWV